MQAIQSFIVDVIVQLINIFRYPLDPSSRIFWLYLLSSSLAAYLVYRAVRRKGDQATPQDAEDAGGSFLQFLFPKRVWSHPSAWLDLRYAVFHKLVSHFLILGLTAGAVAIGYRIVSGGQAFAMLFVADTTTHPLGWVVSVAFMCVLMAVVDLTAWGIHYLQHRVPLLWQFHKVHHSAEVMHPVSNFREHPVDNLAYGFFTGLAYGACFAVSVRWFGMVPSVPTLFGLPLLMFLFNICAYNLRHSHVWLRWPGRWSAIFPSPAHHHVHHSCHPDHIDKNFAFMFPVWDVLMGTYIMPKDNRDVRFGVPEEQGRDLDTVWRLYWVPFRDAYRLFRPSPARASASQPPQTPAE